MIPDQAKSNLTCRIFIVAIWVTVLTQKLALPGNLQVSAVVMLGTIATLFWLGLAKLSITNSVIFASLSILILVQQLFVHGTDFSLPSFLLMVTLYSVFIFVTPIMREDYFKILKGFQNVAVFIALIVYFQWAAQLITGWLPHIEVIIPGGVLYQKYNYLSNIYWGSDLLRPNGIFMLEPSFTSQIIALGVLIEVTQFHRLKFLAVMLPALLVTFAGTGLLLLIVCGPFLLFHMSRRLLIRLGFLTMVLSLILMNFGVFDYFSNRIGEFTKEGTSAYGRFIETYTLAFSTIAKVDGGMFFGIGQGNFPKVIEIKHDTVVFNSISKALMELGLFTGTALIAVIHLAIIRSRAPLVMLVGLFMLYDVLNASLLVPLIIAYCYFLAGAFRIVDPEPAPLSTSENIVIPGSPNLTIVSPSGLRTE